MGTIIIKDLEVHFNVGVPDLERANPQRLLISVELEHDFQAATRADDLAGTIDYFAVCERLMGLGENRVWKLIETLASDIADVVLLEFRPNRVVVGLSKLARVVEAYSRRLQTQERLTMEIANTIFKGLKAQGAAVSINAVHHCMTSRGIKKHEATTVTNYFTGMFKESHNLQNRFLQYIGQK